jgi:hypothetical protein
MPTFDTITSILSRKGHEVCSVPPDRQRVVLEGKSSGNVRVQEIMSNPVITVNQTLMPPNASLLDQGKLAGIVSMGYLASAIISDQAFAIDQLKRYMGQASA